MLSLNTSASQPGGLFNKLLLNSTSILDLPPEVFLEVYRRVAYDHRSLSIEPDFSDLRTGSLVCRTWRQHIQPLLFRNPIIRTLTALRRFRDTIKNNPSLGYAVRILEVWINARAFGFDSIHPNDFAPVLPLCPALLCLCLKLDNFSGFPAASLPILRESYSIEELYLDVDDHTSAGCVAAILVRIPNITKLSVGSHWSDMRPELLRSASFTMSRLKNYQACPLRLREFSTSYSGNGSCLHYFTMWALGNSAGSLEVLEINDVSHLDPDILKSHGPFLRVLRLHDINGLTELIGALHYCTRLEECVLGQYSIKKDVLDALPRDTLRKLVFTRFDTVRSVPGDKLFESFWECTQLR